MQNTIIAALLLAALLILLCWNAFSVIKINDKILEMYENLPKLKNEFENGEALINKICEYWHEKRDYLAISISVFEIERMDEVAAELTAAINCGSFDNYCAAKERLHFVLHMLTAGEKLSWDRIL